MNNDLTQYASISNNGSILLGKNTVVDGYHTGREIGVFTHIHHDHTKYFVSAMHECSEIFVSRPTLDMLAVLDSNSVETIPLEAYFKGRHIHSLDFGKPITPRLHSRQIDPPNMISDMITLHEAHHILGSAQVSVVTDDGKHIVYSGDFSYPQATSIKCNILVLDATHGNPMFNAPVDPGSLENRLVDCIQDEIERGNPVCVRAHLGRLQYTMSILSQRLAENITFIASLKNTKLAEVYRKFGMPIRSLLRSDTYKAEATLEGAYPFVEFKTMPARESVPEMEKKSAVFQLGGMNLGPKTTIRQTDEKKYHIEFGDHGTYDGIMEYVKKCEPELVITDSYRSGWGEILAEKIHSNLGIDAINQP